MRYPGAKVKCINCIHLKPRDATHFCYIREHYRYRPTRPAYCLSFFHKYQTRLMPQVGHK